MSTINISPITQDDLRLFKERLREVSPQFYIDGSDPVDHDIDLFRKFRCKGEIPDFGSDQAELAARALFEIDHHLGSGEKDVYRVIHETLDGKREGREPARFESQVLEIVITNEKKILQRMDGRVEDTNYLLPYARQQLDDKGLSLSEIFNPENNVNKIDFAKVVKDHQVDEMALSLLGKIRSAFGLPKREWDIPAMSRDLTGVEPTTISPKRDWMADTNDLMQEDLAAMVQRISPNPVEQVQGIADRARHIADKYIPRGGFDS